MKHQARAAVAGPHTGVIGRNKWHFRCCSLGRPLLGLPFNRRCVPSVASLVRHPIPYAQRPGGAGIFQRRLVRRISTRFLSSTFPRRASRLLYSEAPASPNLHAHRGLPACPYRQAQGEGRATLARGRG